MNNNDNNNNDSNRDNERDDSIYFIRWKDGDHLYSQASNLYRYAFS